MVRKVGREGWKGRLEGKFGREGWKGRLEGNVGSEGCKGGSREVVARRW